MSFRAKDILGESQVSSESRDSQCGKVVTVLDMPSTLDMYVY